MTVLVRVLQRNRTNRIEVVMYIRGGLLYELAYVIMEAEKSHDPPPASCSTKKASGVIQSKGPVLA